MKYRRQDRLVSGPNLNLRPVKNEVEELAT
jgi:hypothetical protein